MASATGVSVPLQLEVSINGEPANLVGAFTRRPDGALATSAGELRELGVKVEGADDAEVRLDAIPGLTYDFNGGEQTINLMTGDQGRIAKVYDASALKDRPPVDIGTGSVFNYGLFASVSRQDDDDRFAHFDGANLSLDHRIYSPAGVLYNSGILGMTTDSDAEALRLESNWTYTDIDRMVEVTLGDTISGGFQWNRPVRLGGGQVRRNFDVRPDLVTVPLPGLSGSAAVPSTVDVYVNNIKTYSQDIPAGPFVINDIPVITGNGEARVVVRDATGRESETSLPFNSSDELLRQGLLDFSTELGFVRKGYGSHSFDYDDEPAALVSARYGLTDALTLMAHGEGNFDLVNIGAGATAALGRFGVFTGAASYSHFDSQDGVQVFASLEAELMGVDFTLASTRTFGDYADLAYVSGLSAGLSESERLDLLPLKALDRVAAGFQLPGEIGSLGIGAVHIEEAGGDHNYFMTASFNRPFFFNSHLSVSGFAELNGDENFGVGLFLSAPLGGWGHGGAGLEASKDGVTATADVAKARGEEPGSYGWRVHARQDEEFAGRAALSYRASMADMEVSAGYADGSILADAYIEGGLAVTPDGIFPSRRIDDAFAIVDTGAPDVRVFLENRPVGRTNKSGKLLVTGLNSYETNRISIEPDDLPLDAEIGEVERLTVPADRSGARVSFGVKTGLRTALIVIEDSLGKPIPAGTRGTVEATKEAFVVGYGGEVYLKDLSAENVITLDLKQESCNAVFNFKPGSEAQTRIEGVVCE